MKSIEIPKLIEALLIKQKKDQRDKFTNTEDQERDEMMDEQRR